MLHAKQASKRKRRSKAVPVLGAAGLLSLAGGVSTQAAGPAADIPARHVQPSHEITLSEVEVSDVSLATFYVFDKEMRSPPAFSSLEAAAADAVMAVAAAEAEAAEAEDAAAGDAEAEAAAALEAASGAAAAAAAVAEAVACPGAPAPCARLHSRPVADELNQKSRPAANSRAAPSWQHPTSSQIASRETGAQSCLSLDFRRFQVTPWILSNDELCRRPGRPGQTGTHCPILVDFQVEQKLVGVILFSKAPSHCRPSWGGGPNSPSKTNSPFFLVTLNSFSCG